MFIGINYDLGDLVFIINKLHKLDDAIEFYKKQGSLYLQLAPEIVELCDKTKLGELIDIKFETLLEATYIHEVPRNINETYINEQAIYDWCQIDAISELDEFYCDDGTYGIWDRNKINEDVYKNPILVKKFNEFQVKAGFNEFYEG